MPASVRDRVISSISHLTTLDSMDVDTTMSEAGLDVLDYQDVLDALAEEFEVDGFDLVNEIEESSFEDATVQDLIDAVKRVQ